MKIFKRIFSLHLVISLGILALAFAVSYYYGAWLGYPRGDDTLLHLFKTKYILLNWPYHHWWNIWAGGMPLFLYYPPLPHYLLAFVELLTGVSPELLLTLASILAIGFSSLAIYTFVFLITRNRLAALMSAVVYLSTPGGWAMSLNSGVYMRSLAMPFSLFGLTLTMYLFKNHEQKESSTKLIKISAIFWGITILIHQFIAAIGLTTALVMVVFFAKGDLFKKLFTFIKVTALSLIISATLILPFIVHFPNNPSNSWVSPDAQKPVNLNRLWHIPSISQPILSNFDYSDMNRLPSYLLPFTLVLIIITVLSFLKISQDKIRLNKSLIMNNNFSIRMLVFSVLFIFLWFIYSQAIPLKISKAFSLINSAYAFLGTNGAMYFIPIFTGIAWGIMLHLVVKQKKLQFFILTLLILISSYFVTDQEEKIIYSLEDKYLQFTFGVRDLSFPYGKVSKTITEENTDNFRFAVQRIFITDPLFFSLNFPNIPQTGHYFTTGIQNFPLYWDFDYFLWHPESYDQLKFVLDWWGVNNIFAKSINDSFNSIHFNLIEKDKGGSVYSFEESSPILSAVNTPTLLHIGKPETFSQDLIKILAINNLNSQTVIPVWGEETIDQYRENDLKLFDAIIVYDYQVNSFFEFTQTITDYVVSGGNLIIESNSEVESGHKLPDPFPIQKVIPAQREKNFNLKVQEKNYLISQTELDNFSPADFEGNPWNISEAQDLKDWADILVTSDGAPVIVQGKLGKGNVIWSGLNLPFHAITNENQTEIKLVAKILLDVLEADEQDELHFTSSIENPQKRTLFIKDEAKGVLFKESIFPNWKAQAETASGREKLKILKAGPGYMFAFLPKDTKKVFFSYSRSAVEWISDIISLFALGWMITTILWRKSANPAKK